ncbi:MAG: hypothetical protein HYS77_06965 [Candidatus Rokubacteria bacterium]|nr:hypothetical protein [Candidatus Rokubacteria bacterium]
MKGRRSPCFDCGGSDNSFYFRFVCADRIFLQAECPWPEFEEQMRMIRAEILDRRADIFRRAGELSVV